MQYLGRRTLPPLQTIATPTMEDRLFADLHQVIPKPNSQEASENTWISEDTWILVDMRVSVHQYLARDQGLIRNLGRHIAASLKADHRQQMKTARGDIETLLALYPPPPLFKE